METETITLDVHIGHANIDETMLSMIDASGGSGFGWIVLDETGPAGGAAVIQITAEHDDLMKFMAVYDDTLSDEDIAELYGI